MNMDEPVKMTCDRIIILAAGRARRMKESAEGVGDRAIWTQDALNRPKPMIRIGSNGEPMLQFILEQSLRAGFTEVTLVIAPDDPLTASFASQWNREGVGEKMRIRCVVQDQPLGTGHAVRCALEQDPVPTGKAWVLCNGDNLPSRSALARLRGMPTGQALLAYDRNHLGLDPAKTMAFAVLEGDGQRIRRIVEKPTAEEVQALETRGPVRVSMNVFRLDAQVLMPFLSQLQPHPTRGELELPTALQAMMDAGYEMEQLDTAEEVLDLTRLQDVTSVRDGMHLMEPFQLEVCASSPLDVHTAARGGAHRVELCAHWECGGLTSPETDIRAALKAGIPVHALVRPRAGHFAYTHEEKSWMTEQIQAVLDAGASRAVVGGLRSDGTWDAELTARWAEEFGGHRLVVHRALDACMDWQGAAAALRESGIRRLLSSGGKEAAWGGRARIRDWMQAGFEVTVGSGVRPQQRADWLGMGIQSFHASCRERKEHATALFDGVHYPVQREAVEEWFVG